MAVSEAQSHPKYNNHIPVASNLQACRTTCKQFLYFFVVDLILLRLCNSVCVCCVVILMLYVFISGLCGAVEISVFNVEAFVKFNVEELKIQFATRRRHVLLARSFHGWFKHVPCLFVYNGLESDLLICLHR